jgi:hypothetical protein
VSTHTLRKKVSEWDTVAWKTTRAGNETATVMLNAGEYFYVEEGWEIDGPIRVKITYSPSTDKTTAKYSPLPSDVFDIDNPYEYPCASCGASRHEVCVGDKPECVYRVFLMKGGML